MTGATDLEHARPVTFTTRGLLLLAGMLVVLAGLTLFVFPTETAQWFAWTINPPLTAAFLGASYWSAGALQFGAATRYRWADARIAVPGVLLFTVLTLIVTLVHLAKFHLGPEQSVLPRSIAQVWILVYATVPVLLAVVWWRQVRLPGSDPARLSPLPRVVRYTSAVQAVVLIGCGVALLIAPEWVANVWPWDLTALTGRAIGAWLVSLGVVAGQAVFENDIERIRPAAMGALAFVALQAITLARFWSDFRMGAAMVVYLVVLASFLVTGMTAFLRVRAPDEAVGA